MSELRMGLWPTHRDENRVEPEAMHALRPPRPTPSPFSMAASSTHSQKNPVGRPHAYGDGALPFEASDVSGPDIVGVFIYEVKRAGVARDGVVF
jgi:hypothetical protein